MRAWVRPLAVCLALASCAPPLPSPVVHAQEQADLTGVVMALLRSEPLIVWMAPAAFTRPQKLAMASDLDAAVRNLARLKLGLPDEVQRIDASLAYVVNTLAAVVPITPKVARWSGMLDAIDAVRPGIVSPARGVRVPAMTQDQGRRALGIPVVP